MAAVDPGVPARSASPPRPRRVPRVEQPLPYLNRELSWLEFNARVLYEAGDTRNPLLERVKFLTIFASNLDEFFQVRIAGLREQVEAGSTKRSPDGRTADGTARCRPRPRPRARRRAFRDLRRRPAGPRRRGRGARRVRRDPPAPRGPSRAVLRRDLPRPDATRGGSRPPVPVHLHAEPVDRGRPARSGDRRAGLRAREGAGDPAAPAGGRAVALRAHRPGHRGEPGHALLGHGDPRASPVPGHAQRRPGARGGRGGRPPDGDRGGVAPPALRRGGPRRGRTLHARQHAGSSCHAGWA